ncbi:MAG: trypsin-like peptidase domain-containing protein [Rhizobacter sp.]|nr:trypsin-like peptidase domain-containing protein [Rhizobacter sp.]
MRVHLRRLAGRLALAAIAASALSSSVCAAPPPPASPPAPTAAPSADPAASAPVSMSARRVYEQARSQLVQIRTVLKGQASQTSVGSGFLVSREGHLITNFHVVSEAALKPDRHDLVLVNADGREAPVKILMLDVLHDLALLKVDDPKTTHYDALAFRPDTDRLAQGERMYSLGNPLDVGFAVIEGNYNGLVERSFYPQIFFAGSLSAGMSGGPALDQEGRVIGVNVARRVDGEQVSFLVPATFASALLARGRDAPPLKGEAWPIVATQLMAHQDVLTQRFIAQGWKPATHPRYTVPVPPDRFMRCWGSSEPSRTGGLDFERSDCVMDTRIFVGDFNTGTLATRHEAYDGRKLGTLRFASQYSASFRNESFLRLGPQHQTKPQCHEDFVDRQGLVLRAVVCLRAYKKLPQLYDLSVLVATLDQPQAGVQGRFDVQGVSYPNAMKLAQHYLEAYAWVK